MHVGPQPPITVTLPMALVRRKLHIKSRITTIVLLNTDVADAYTALCLFDLAAVHPQMLVSRLGVTVVQSTLDCFGQITLCEISRGLKCFHVYPGHVQVRERNEKLRLPCFWRAPTSTERSCTRRAAGLALFLA